jgi:hypothetical protein
MLDRDRERYRREDREIMQRMEQQGIRSTSKKENKIFLIYKKIQKGAVAKSYMTNGLIIW